MLDLLFCMITTVASITLEMAEFDTCLVKVLDVVYKLGAIVVYKQIHVQEEIGYWFQTYYFNLFENRDLYKKIEPGMHLQIKVSPHLY